ncbi:DUF3021 family protein [Alkalibacillus almallahensis]|uniref:DUF3021 family protein n=1 Tax=Alkalibacillus almallahensis TaxID=1379154 RepID=UPI001421D608|nr:DUF3021 family protein [Alkalibacillus almallahensis]
MIKKKLLTLLLVISLSANAMVIVTWIITDAMGYDLISPIFLFRNMIATVGIVGINTVLGWFYEKSDNLLFVSSLHFIVAITTFLGLGLWAKWFPLEWGVLLTVTLIYTGIFIVIWLGHYFYWKNQIDQMNSKLG